MDVLSILNDIIDEVENLKLDTKSFVKIKAYQETIDIILRHVTDIEEAIQLKIDRLMKKFDAYHNDYQTILERGHIGIPTSFHYNLSEFSKGMQSIELTYDNFTDEHKEFILSTLITGKDMNEQLTAARHDYHYITHTKGHDGIDPDNNVYEAKNRTYTHTRKQKMPGSLPFSAPSKGTLRKLDEGRPMVIFNMTDAHRLIFEMTIDFSDEMIEFYEKYVDERSVEIPFEVYKDSIREVTFIADNFDDYTNMQTTLYKYIQAYRADNVDSVDKKVLVEG